MNTKDTLAQRFPGLNIGDHVTVTLKSGTAKAGSIFAIDHEAQKLTLVHGETTSGRVTAAMHVEIFSHEIREITPL